MRLAKTLAAVDMAAEPEDHRMVGGVVNLSLLRNGAIFPRNLDKLISIELNSSHVYAKEVQSLLQQLDGESREEVVKILLNWTSHQKEDMEIRVTSVNLNFAARCWKVIEDNLLPESTQQAEKMYTDLLAVYRDPKCVAAQTPLSFRDAKRANQVVNESGYLMVDPGSTVYHDSWQRAWLPRAVVSPERDRLFEQLARDERVLQHTLLDPNRLYVLWQGLQNTIHLAGDSIEVGAYRGGTSIFLMLAQRALKSPVASHLVVDTFEGHVASEVSDADTDHVAGMFSDTSVEAVRAATSEFAEARVLKGTMPEVGGEIEDRSYRFVHLDVDLYQPTREYLDFFAQRLVTGGILVVDDYCAPKAPGIVKAVHEFLETTEGYAISSVFTEQLVLQKR